MSKQKQLIIWHGEKHLRLNFLAFGLGSFLLFLSSFAFSFLVSSCLSNDVSAAARQSSITLGISTSTVSANATPNRLANSNEQTITVRTDNFTGYTLSIEATNNNARNLSDGNGHSIETITSAITTNEFSNNANYANKWGYKLNQYITTTAGVNTTIQNENYLPAPTAQGDTLDITTEANSNNNSYTVGFGAKVDNTMPAGAYSSIFVYRTIANDIGYVVYYDENTEDQVDDMPDPNPEEATLPGGTVTADSYITLSDATPTRTGFTFSGWCDVATTEDSTTHSQTCPGNTYAAGADYGIDQTLDNTNIELYAVWTVNTYTVNIKTAPGITKVAISRNNTEICSATDTTGTNCTLTYNVEYDLTATLGAGYNFDDWGNQSGKGTVDDPTSVTTTYTVGDGSTNIYPETTPKTYTITLNQNGATTSGSTSTTATYDATTLSSITLPQRKYTVSGFTAGTNASGASISSTTTLTSTYTFNGWYKESGATNKIASNSTTPALQANTSYTDANSKWTNDGAVTLYAGWSSQSIILPTITKTGYTCGWSTNQSATDYTYASGASLTPSANTTLYGICKPNTYTITLNKNGGTNSPTTSTTATYDATTLGTIATLPTRSYTISGFTNTSSGANSIVSSTSTLTSNYTFDGWYKESAATNKIASSAATPALQASTSYTDANSKWTSTSDQTLYAGWTGQAKTLPTITRTGSTCGWATSSTATTWNYNSGASFTPTGNTTLYGVCRNDITLNNSGATTAGSTSATVNYNATSLSNITVPQRKYTVSGFTKTDSAANSTVSSTNTLTNNATFNGWYTASSGGTKVASSATTPALQASTTYTNASSQWTYTTASAVTLYSQFTDNAVTLPTITRTGSTCGWSTSSTATTITYNSGASFTPTANTTLYGVCVTNITLDRNGGNSGSTSATVNYGATSLSSITAPGHANDTYTVSGFTKTTSATNSTVSSTTTLNSTRSYTFAGWYKESAGTNKIAGTGNTPALEASTTYTNSSKQWTYTTAGNITLYAKWTASNFSAVTLPTITRTGSTCGWSTSSTATTITYNSGASITPTSNLTLYGVCRNNITLNGNGATNSYSTSTTATYNATTLGSITTPTRSYTLSSFDTSYNNASGATVSSTASKTSTYTFDGWYTATSGGTKIASSATTPALQASTTYTNSSSQWTYTTASSVNLYAQWTGGSVTLPTITKTGHNCGWTTSTSTTTITYNSGASITPTSNMTLHGVCVANTYSLYINFAGSGVSSVQVRTASGTGGTLKGTVSSSGGYVSGLTYNTAYYLYPTFSSGYEFSSWAKTSGSGTLSSTSASNPTFTMGAGNGTVTITGKSSVIDYCALKGVTNANCMQKMTSSNCTTTAKTVTDSRDGSDYTARYINGNCWMTQNLRITGTIRATDSNFSSPSSFNTAAGGDLRGGSATYTAAQSHLADSTDVSASASATGGPYTTKQLGAWYNYCAASAGQVCSQTKMDATQDICPAGWRLPTNSEQIGIISYASAYNPIYGGYYYDGSLYYATAYGRWWASTANVSANYQFTLHYNNGSLNTIDIIKSVGLYIRCILNSS